MRVHMYIIEPELRNLPSLVWAQVYKCELGMSPVVECISAIVNPHINSSYTSLSYTYKSYTSQ